VRAALMLASTPRMEQASGALLELSYPRCAQEEAKRVMPDVLLPKTPTPCHSVLDTQNTPVRTCMQVKHGAAGHAGRGVHKGTEMEVHTYWHAMQLLAADVTGRHELRLSVANNMDQLDRHDALKASFRVQGSANATAFMRQWEALHVREERARVESRNRAAASAATSGESSATGSTSARGMSHAAAAAAAAAAAVASRVPGDASAANAAAAAAACSRMAAHHTASGDPPPLMRCSSIGARNSSASPGVDNGRGGGTNGGRGGMGATAGTHVGGLGFLLQDEAALQRMPLEGAFPGAGLSPGGVGKMAGAPAAARRSPANVSAGGGKASPVLQQGRGNGKGSGIANAAATLQGGRGTVGTQPQPWR